jgi:hypothetical protein
METLNSLQNKLQQLGTLNLRNPTNIGSANSGVIAQEYGDAYNHTTVLSINKSAAFALADNAAKAVGYLIYTLPAGAIIVNNAHMALTVTNTEHTANATGEIGLGTVIGSGAVATLNLTATFENILTGLPSYAMGTVGTSTDISNSTTGIGGLIIPTASAHTVHVNLASTWANTAGLALNADLTGFVILNWTFLV